MSLKRMTLSVAALAAGKTQHSQELGSNRASSLPQAAAASKERSGGGTNKKKRIVLLAVLGVAAAVGAFLLGADFFVFVGGGGNSNFHRKQLKKADNAVKVHELFQKRDSLTTFIDPQTVIFMEDTAEQRDIIKLGFAAEGSTFFRVHPRIDDEASAIFLPSEIMIEVLNPDPNCRYSVTILSHDLYTGTAMRLAEGQFKTNKCPSGLRECHLVYSWRPILPGQYDILVHEIDQSFDKTPLIQPPHTFLVTEWAAGVGLSMLEDRIMNMTPCQIWTENNVYSHWEGDWLGPNFQLENSIRTGWSFLPSSRMGCKIETFDSQALRSLPEKKSIYILGRSVERGIFLSLADIMLEEHEKVRLKRSIVGKCWGRAAITKGNLQVLYQDFRSTMFEDPTEPPFIECHNDKLVKEVGSSFITNATKVWEEIFQQEESSWPSVIYLVTGYGTVNFMFDYHVKWFVDMLPPSWQGTLFLGEQTLSSRWGGYANLPEYEQYLKDVDAMLNALGNDPRVRWIDGHGISKEMRMYSETGEEYVARSQHFHRYCTNTGINGEAMTVCSNVTEMMGQLLLGHTLGPKADFMERVGQAPSKRDTLMWCHACPKCLLPFKIVPYPKMECVEGPILPKEESHSCPNRDQRLQSYQNNSLLCPLSCLKQEVTSESRSESDIIFVRQCPTP